MAFDKEKLKTHLSECGITQQDLATLVGKDVRTIRRWLSPKRQISSAAVEKICQALRVSPETFDPDWSGATSSSREVQIGARVSVASANGYTILKRQYGVSKKQLMELAPVMFAVIAQRALNRGKRAKQQAEKRKILARLLNFSAIDPQMSELEFMESELLNRAAEEGQIFGFDPEETANMPSNLFSHELYELSEEVQAAWFKHTPWNSCPTAERFAHSEALLSEITNGDKELKSAIEKGQIDLSTMEAHLWDDTNTPERLRWLRQQANNFTLMEKRSTQKFVKFLKEEHPKAAEFYETHLIENEAQNVVSFDDEKERRNDS